MKKTAQGDEQSFRIFERIIGVGDETLETIGGLFIEMAAFELTVRTAVRGYHDYKEVKLGTRNRQRIVYHQ